jgi:hypothetical protein
VLELEHLLSRATLKSSRMPLETGFVRIDARDLGLDFPGQSAVNDTVNINQVDHASFNTSTIEGSLAEQTKAFQVRLYRKH